MKITAAALIIAISVSASATTTVPGDVAVAAGAYCCCITCPPDPAVLLMDNAGHTKALLPAAGAVAFGPTGHLFAGSRTNVVEYDTSLNVVRTMTPINNAYRIAIAHNGDVYVLGENALVTVFSSTGAVKKTVTLANSGFFPLAWDLGPDGCTLYYTDNTLAGRRYDACRDQQLADLEPGPWYALRTTSDGGYVVVNDTAVKVFDADNHVVRIVAANRSGGPWALSFDIDPGVLWWVAGRTMKFRFAWNTQTVITAAYGSSIAVNGEWRPTSAALATASIPAVSPLLLVALAAALAAIALTRAA